MDISVIIPAYNEEGRIGNVLSPLMGFELIKEIIVVNDGSEDLTAKEARQYPVTLIELPFNQGKAAAIKRGLEASTGEWILFLDADLKGLRKEHLISMIEYTKIEGIDMVIGTFTKGKLITDLSHKIAPFLSGQRLIKRTILEAMPHFEHARYGIEIMITGYAHKMGCQIKKVKLPHVYHIPKEQKRGWIKGKIEKYSMYRNIISTLFESYFLSRFKWIKKLHRYSS
ncbi:glycosyltransferase family 2 protein [Defluviitalea saccharophila]|uniref:Glucosyl-3-phosphoglycerate synthase n=1 Tax=Defluviitalea saccharophila TaxID=879970 RepID=A0ABZ2YAK6_9FIRM|nr:glycosyltransferase family 2 protein [Candidatus Epulonipiscium sp.]